MPITPTVYDWPSIFSVAQLFHSGGQAAEGAYTTGNVAVLTPEPGGVAWLEMEFGFQKYGATDKLISWAMTAVANRNVFRVKLDNTPQLVSFAALGLTPTTAELLTGIPWDNDQPWDNDKGWDYEPLLSVVSAAGDGVMQLTVDFGSFLPGVQIGEVFGHRDVIYMAMDIEYDGTEALITLDRPLKKDALVNDFVSLRPRGTFTMSNPDSFRGLYRLGDVIKLGTARWQEAIL